MQISKMEDSKSGKNHKRKMSESEIDLRTAYNIRNREDIAKFEKNCESEYITMLRDGELKDAFAVVMVSRHFLHISDSEGNTLFHYACMKGNYKIARLLLLINVEYGIKNIYGETGLKLAKDYEQNKIVELIEMFEEDEDSII